MPFWRLDSEVPPDDVMLRQVGPNAFQLLEGFRYKVPDTSQEVYTVPAHGPGASTDLASVPFWLWWFVASYGKHTRAALLHDELVDLDDVDRVHADHVFRLALEESKVRWMRRWLMWAAVRLATMWHTTKLQFFAFVALLAAFVVLLVTWAFGWDAAWLPAAAVLVVGAIAWRKLWLLAVVGLLLIAVPTVFVWLVLAIVWVLDFLKYVYGKARGRPVERPNILPFREQQRKF